ncbi:MAG: phage tail fiber protein, partial [Burkholderiales bacterium]
MANNKTLTSSNSVLALVVAGLFPVPVAIQGYATDRSITTEALGLAEVQMGVDARMSAGYTPNPTNQ